MAKRQKKTGGDFPPLYLIVEKGRLVGASNYDYERIMSWRDGTRMVCELHPDGTRKGVRNWYRIIGTACRKGLLHGLTQTQADEAIRGALDMFTPVRMANGKWIEQRTSLTDLNDAELDEKVERMKELLLAWTGVDPDDFDREIVGAHNDDAFESDISKEGFARQPAADDAGSGGADSSSPDAAAESGAATPSPESPSPNSPLSNETPAVTEASTLDNGDGGLPEQASAEATEAGRAEPGPADRPVSALPDEDQEWLRESAKALLKVAQEGTPRDAVIRACRPILLAMPRGAERRDTGARLESIKQHVLAVARGDKQLDWDYVAKMAITTVKDLAELE